MAVSKFLKEAEKLKELHTKKDHGEGSHGGGGHDDGEGNWLISYADMMTLLCGFFIMLFSMAKLDEPKYESFKEEVSKQFGGQYVVPDSTKLAKVMSQVLHEMGIEKDVVIQSDPMGVAVIFQSTVFFETLSSEVKPQGKAILNKLIEGIATRQVKEGKQYKVVVEGHTDSRAIIGGTFPSNWELSGARAARVVRMFLEYGGFSPGNMAAIGYGDTRPQVESRSSTGEFIEEALAKNRRVVLRVMEPNVDSIPYPESAGAPVPASAAAASGEAPAPITAPAIAPVAPPETTH